ncbi:MAG TPA: CoA transferase [Gaiellaceae bacterium]|nr:CoA transferase [Gaiellaceae bacterium]
MPALDGMRAVSLAVNVPGPTTAARLVALGASVTKVEPPSGDPLAAAHPAWYDELRGGQQVLTLDLKQATDHAILDELLRPADLLLTSSRPDALTRLGLAWPALHARFPHLCQVAIVGYPEPEQERAGHDLTYAAAHGLVVPPDLPRTLVADLGGAELATTAALDLLLARERGGEAGYAEVALADAAAAFAAPLRQGATVEGGPLGGGLPQYGLYAARDGWIAVAALEPQFEQRLAAELGLDALTHEALAAAFSTRSAEDWEAWGREHDLPLSAVQDVGSAG